MFSISRIPFNLRRLFCYHVTTPFAMEKNRRSKKIVGTVAFVPALSIFRRSYFIAINNARYKIKNLRETGYGLLQIVFRADGTDNTFLGFAHRLKLQNCSAMSHGIAKCFAREGTQKRPSALIRFYCVLRCERNCDRTISRVPSFATRINHRAGTSEKTSTVSQAHTYIDELKKKQVKKFVKKACEKI